MAEVVERTPLSPAAGYANGRLAPTAAIRKSKWIAMSAFHLIVLQKSFWADQRKFLGPLMRFALGDVRDHMISRKSDPDPRIGAMDRCSDRNL